MENIKQSKEEVSVIYSFKFRETCFRRHDPKEFFPRELSQQGILVKSNIPTLEKMMQIDKRVEKKKVSSEKKIQNSHHQARFKSIHLVSFFI